MSELELYKSTGFSPAEVVELKYNYELIRKKLHLIELNRAVNSFAFGKGAYKIGDTIYTKRDYRVLLNEIKRLRMYLNEHDFTALETLDDNLSIV